MASRSSSSSDTTKHEALPSVVERGTDGLTTTCSGMGVFNTSDSSLTRSCVAASSDLVEVVLMDHRYDNNGFRGSDLVEAIRPQIR